MVTAGGRWVRGASCRSFPPFPLYFCFIDSVFVPFFLFFPSPTFFLSLFHPFRLRSSFDFFFPFHFPAFSPFFAAAPFFPLFPFSLRAFCPFPPPERRTSKLVFNYLLFLIDLSRRSSARGSAPFPPPSKNTRKSLARPPRPPPPLPPQTKGRSGARSAGSDVISTRRKWRRTALFHRPRDVASLKTRFFKAGRGGGEGGRHLHSPDLDPPPHFGAQTHLSSPSPRPPLCVPPPHILGVLTTPPPLPIHKAI